MLRSTHPLVACLSAKSQDTGEVFGCSNAAGEGMPKFELELGEPALQRLESGPRHLPQAYLHPQLREQTFYFGNMRKADEINCSVAFLFRSISAFSKRSPGLPWCDVRFPVPAALTRIQFAQACHGAIGGNQTDSPGGHSLVDILAHQWGEKLITFLSFQELLSLDWHQAQFERLLH